MSCSEARIAANRRNSQKSCGPRTEAGKGVSRCNGLKHGLTGRGLVTPEEDNEEIQNRVEALTADMKPKSPGGVLLITRMAMLSVRVERAFEHESAEIARNVRHAADDFDEKRVEEAEALFEALADDPRGNLRKLCKSPEGVERLIEEWHDLRADLSPSSDPSWTEGHLERAARLIGLTVRQARWSRIGTLSRATWGGFEGLTDQDVGELGKDARRAWARAALLEQIDVEITALENHYETLDFALIELDRAEAGQRALFDPSKSATLARRYESEAHRGFFKALAEFRRVEAESEALAESAPMAAEPVDLGAEVGSCRDSAPQTTTAPVRAVDGMGSCRESALPRNREASHAAPDGPSGILPLVVDSDGSPSRPLRQAGTAG